MGTIAEDTAKAIKNHPSNEFTVEALNVTPLPSGKPRNRNSIKAMLSELTAIGALTHTNGDTTWYKTSLMHKSSIEQLHALQRKRRVKQRKELKERRAQEDPPPKQQTNHDQGINTNGAQPPPTNTNEIIALEILQEELMSFVGKIEQQLINRDKEAERLRNDIIDLIRRGVAPKPQ